jgi:hypothetical protein
MGKSLMEVRMFERHRFVTGTGPSSTLVIATRVTFVAIVPCGYAVAPDHSCTHLNTLYVRTFGPGVVGELPALRERFDTLVDKVFGTSD